MCIEETGVCQLFVDHNNPRFCANAFPLLRVLSSVLVTSFPQRVPLGEDVQGDAFGSYISIQTRPVADVPA
eukprot:49222-Eustigmatos_ZCMA.PRE.1